MNTHDSLFNSRKITAAFTRRLVVWLFLGIFILPELFACAYCNKRFRESLLAERKGTLLADELLAAIAAQEPSSAEVLAPADKAQAASPQRSASATGSLAARFPQEEFVQILRRDERLPVRQTSYVPQGITPDTSVTITLEERDVYIGNGVIYSGFTTNGTIPGPTIVLTEGDIVRFTIVNKSKTIPHGASIHSAYTQTSKYLGKIQPGDSASITFRVTQPGVYMYHCAPGGHAIPMHIIFGQYGMFVVQPKKQQFELERQLGKGPDLELYLIQHEYYAHGKDATEGQGKPMYTAFNGKLFRYVEAPIKAKPGDYVRIHFLNIGPNLVSTFHIVGIIWDYVYWQGHPENRFTGGQTVTAGPSDSWTIEFRMPPDEGSYLMLSHAVGSTDRGAIGLLVCDREAPTPARILADGEAFTDEELENYASKSIRTISPYKPGTLDVDPYFTYRPDEEVIVRIQGNAFYPKRIKIHPGTKVTWVNEDVFSYMEGEFSGIHNVVASGGPERFGSELMAHAERYSYTFDKEGEYTYMCTPHPYMQGIVEVTDEGNTGNSAFPWSLILAIIALALAVFTFLRSRKS